MNTKRAVCFGCDAVRDIGITLSFDRCECGGNLLPLLDIDAFHGARLAHRLGSGYYVHSTLLSTVQGADRSGPIDWSRTGEALRKDGTCHSYAIDHYLKEAFENSRTADDLDLVWLTGALINLGDALGQRDYFDRAPQLELVRHLRNGIAHGNRFRIDRPENLLHYPANNHTAQVRSPVGSNFEITPAVQGCRVMFDFMGPADLVDLFFSVELHLFSLAVLTT